jgi:antitoxin component of RelBE/YafQ-DinJ toxin-antitoxin module
MKNKNIIIRIDEELKNRATAAAAANNTTVTEILTNFLKDYSKDFKH